MSTKETARKGKYKIFALFGTNVSEIFPNGYQPPRDINKYKVQRLGSTGRCPVSRSPQAEQDGVDKLLSQQERNHPLTPAFTCRLWYNEITSLYYTAIEHEITLPYYCLCWDYRSAVGQLSNVPQRFPMLEAIGTQNALHIVNLTLRHDMSLDWGYGRLQGSMRQQGRVAETMGMVIRLMHLVVAEIQMKFPRRPRNTNIFEDGHGLQLIFERDASALAKAPGVIYRASIQELFAHLPHLALPATTSWSKVANAGDYYFRKSYQSDATLHIRPSARLGKNHQVNISAWGSMVRKKARLLLQADDQQAFSSALEASLAETREAYRERDQKRKGSTNRAASLLFYGKEYQQTD